MGMMCEDFYNIPMSRDKKEKKKELQEEYAAAYIVSLKYLYGDSNIAWW
jgi:hypothetical protein